jgi:bacterial/archaeal transporter family protein
MNSSTFVLALLSMFSWGIGSFTAKIAADRIGGKAVFWDLIGYASAIIFYTLFTFKARDYIGVDKLGAVLAIFSGMIGSFGAIFLYILLTKKDASVAVPITAIYPALTAILAFIFLKEQLTAIKVIGILFSVIALFLLSL